jgi:lysophospholipase L1-like esterase
MLAPSRRLACALLTLAVLGASTHAGAAPRTRPFLGGRSMRFLALGDSYTIGEGVAAEQRWPAQLAARLNAGGIAIEAPRIIATTGWTTADLARAMDTERPHGPFALVSLLIGVNNQYQGRPLEEYRHEFEALLARAVALAGGDARHVIVLSIPDWSVTPFAADRDRATIASEIDRFNDVARVATGNAGAAWVDVTAASRLAGADARSVTGDGLHPSGAAYARWAELALPAALAALAAKTR